MKFFLDTANVEELLKASEWGIVDGVTTNPTLIAREGTTTAEQINRICEIIDGDVSAEVISTTAEEMLAEGRQLAQMHENAVVKLPLTPAAPKTSSILPQARLPLNLPLSFSA